MLKGPFRSDKKFIKYCNENVVHLIRFEGDKKKTVRVKEEGKLVERDYYLPGFTAAELNEIGDDAVTLLRDDDAPREYRLPRLEIWSAERKLLHVYGPGSKVISNEQIVKAARDAQKKLGKSMSRKHYRFAMKQLDALDAALKKGDASAAATARRNLQAMTDLTPAFKAEVAERG